MIPNEVKVELRLFLAGELWEVSTVTRVVAVKSFRAFVREITALGVDHCKD